MTSRAADLTGAAPANAAELAGMAGMPDATIVRGGENDSPDSNSIAPERAGARQMRYSHGWNNWTNGQLPIEPAIDRFFARAFDVPVWSGGADVQELADRAEIALDVPGVKPEQISVSAEHRTLTVKVEREGRAPYVRQYTIGTKYDLGGVQARLELGVLKLSLPKAAEAQPRTVPVTVA
jgi:HSP20 family protein